MHFTELKLSGAFTIDIEKFEDSRGFFARTWCIDEYKSQKINFNICQCNTSFNNKRGTVRGMHYQLPPYEEAKIVSCIKGSIFDVIIDIRPESETYKQWVGVEITSENRKMLYIPKGFAHGFQTLDDNTEVLYFMSEFYKPDYSRGIRWDDKRINIKWPITSNITISDKDKMLEDFNA